MITRVLVVSDTHAPSRWRRGCPEGLGAAVASRPDLILHAGDVCTPEIIGWLRSYAPTHVVFGNNDLGSLGDCGATHAFSAVVQGVAVAMLHDSGATAGRAARMRRHFPDADVVVYGHSHIPYDAVDAATGVHLFNPGSPTDPRRQPFGTYGELVLDAGTVTSALFRADDPERRPLTLSSGSLASPTTTPAASAAPAPRRWSRRGA